MINFLIHYTVNSHSLLKIALNIQATYTKPLLKVHLIGFIVADGLMD